jgi:hypothetical protein
MPSYLVRWKSGGGPNWAHSAIVDTGDTVPTAAQPATFTVTGLVSGQAYDLEVVRLLFGGSEGRSSGVRSVLPAKVSLDWSDGFSAGLSIGWTDQRGGRYYRIERWTTATDDPAAADITTTSVDVGSVRTTSTASLAGLTNGVTYRMRVSRLNGPDGVVQRTTGVITGTPTSSFDSTAGFDGLGPSTSSPGGQVKAQFVTEASTGYIGILISLNNQGYESVAVTYIANNASPAGTVTTRTWTSASNFTSQSLGTRSGNKTYFLSIPSDSFPVLVPSSDPAQQGATVVLTNNGQGNQFTVTPTYV